jgi:23S rRNA pseudouridine2605 synthase
MERLQKVIAQAGVCSRREAEKLIIAGKVMVNSNVVTELGTKVNSDDVVMVNNKVIKRSRLEYYLLYKPKNIISSTNDEFDRTTVIDLIKSKNRLYPIGRLDYDTTGVLLINNDGE